MTLTTTATRQDVMKFLQKEFNCKVAPTEEYGWSEGGIIILSTEEQGTLFNYGASDWDFEEKQYTCGIANKLVEALEDTEWFFEWQDAGTIMMWN